MRYNSKNDIPTGQDVWVAAFQGSYAKVKPLRNFKPTKGKMINGLFYKYNKTGELSKNYTYDFRYSDEQYFVYTDNKEECGDGYNLLIKAVLYDVMELKKKYESLIISNYKLNIKGGNTNG